MLIDKSHRSWVIATLVLFAVSYVAYLYYVKASFTNGGTGPSGATWPGLAFGIVGFAVMVFCGLLGARRKVRVWRLGRATTWMKAHIWLGLLAFPLILFHSAMLLGNHLTYWLMMIFIVVEVTGIVGILLQNLVPRSMLEMVKAETTFEQIPFVIESLNQEAVKIVSSVCGPLEEPKPDAEAPTPGADIRTGIKADGRVQGKEIKHKGKPTGPVEGSLPLKNFYLDEIKPFLGREYRYKSNLAAPQRAEAVFAHTQTLLPVALHEQLNELKSVCEERRQIALQERLHVWLHLWEYVHIPLSYLLLALSLFHVIVATFGYSGILNK